MGPVVGAEPARQESAAEAVLEVEHVDCSYGPLQVLFDVSLTVQAGGRVALLGTNGAGKSTLLKVITGLQPPGRGSVRFCGEDITTLRPEERVSRGIVQVPGGRAIFPSLSVVENLRMAGYTFWRDRRTIDSRMEEVFCLFPQLADRRSQPGGTLSGGEQQMVALGRAIIAAPALLLIDELSLGLAPVVLQEIVRVLEEIMARGTTVLLVEQSLNVALALTDTAYFMEKGTVRFSGLTAELFERGDLVRSVFFGGEPTGGREV